MEDFERTMNAWNYPGDDSGTCNAFIYLTFHGRQELEIIPVPIAQGGGHP